MKKHGFTLMELLVYMAIVGIVVVLAGQVFSDSTRMRIRTQGMIESNQIAGDVAALFKGELGQMGAKSSQYSRSITSDSFYVASQVYMDEANGDYSSFNLKTNDLGDNKRGDSITFRYARFNTEGEYESVQEVSWFLKNSVLWRTCKTIEGTEETSCPKDASDPVALAEGVKSFEITPSKPGVLQAEIDDATLFPGGDDKNVFRFVSRFDGAKYFRANMNPDEGGSVVAVSGFVSNYNYDLGEMDVTKKVNEFYAAEKNGNAGEWSDLCTRLSFEKNVAYEISFKLMRLNERDRSQMFVVGKDYMAVGFRNLDGSATPIKDFAFYPPMADEVNDVERHMKFILNQDLTNVCLAFSVAAYSPLLSMGTLNVNSLKVLKSEDANYRFVDGYVPELADKRNVKAFWLKLSVEKNKENGSVSLVVSVPSNGIGNH